MSADDLQAPATLLASDARRRPPNRRRHVAFDFEHGAIRYTVGLGCFDNGEPAELFLNVGRYGTGAGVAACDAAVAASLALQYGCPLDTLRQASIRNSDGSAAGVLGAALDLIAMERGRVNEPSAGDRRQQGAIANHPPIATSSDNNANTTGESA